MLRIGLIRCDLCIAGQYESESIKKETFKPGRTLKAKVDDSSSSSPTRQRTSAPWLLIKTWTASTMPSKKIVSMSCRTALSNELKKASGRQTLSSSYFFVQGQW